MTAPDLTTRSGRRVAEAALVLAAGALVCATAMVPLGPEPSVRAWVLAAIAAGLVIAALASRSAPAVRATAVVAAVFVIFTADAWLGVGPVVTTVAVSAVPLLVLMLLGRRTAWRPALPWYGSAGSTGGCWPGPPRPFSSRSEG